MTNRFPDESVFEACRLCPRECGVNRRRTVGYCRAGVDCRVYRFGPHDGEEPPFSGTRGSGTVFFSHCNMRCLYCQNYPWSQQDNGRILDEAQLVAVFETLYRRRCHNWNLVSPAPWLPNIVRAIEPLRRRGIRLPVVYNTSGYESVATLAAVDGWVDVFLTDLRYADPRTAAEASQASDYVRVARDALLEMWRLKGPLQTDAEGIARRGVVCRILVLPGRAAEAMDNLAWLARHVGTDIPVSLMAQYVPAWHATQREGWNRTLTVEEYRPVKDAMSDLGFTSGWLQEVETERPASLFGYNMTAEEPRARTAG